MRHPIFKYFKQYLHLLPEVKKLFENYDNKEVIEQIRKNLLKKIEAIIRKDFPPGSVMGVEDDGLHIYAASMFSKIVIAYLIIENGLVFIDATADDWKSEFSEKTIGKLNPAQIKLPFSVGLLRIKHEEVLDVLFLSDNDRITLKILGLPQEYNNPNLEEVIKKHFTEVQIDVKHNTVEESLNDSKLNDYQKTEVYQILSAFMYITMARESEEYKKTVTKKIVKGTPSRKNNIPKHTMNYVKVTQKKAPSVNSTGDVVTHRESTWLVRGHWRNQWYAKEGVNKPKWIDAHWRGKGKKVIEKIYKLSKETV